MRVISVAYLTLAPELAVPAVPQRGRAPAAPGAAPARPRGRHPVTTIRGDIANLYQVRQGMLKIVRDPADNDLMRREATALTRLQDVVDPALLAYFPPLVATGQRDDARSG